MLCLLALAVSGAARQSDAPTALVKNMTEAYKTEKVMEGRVVFAFYYDSSKNGGNSPVGWSNTFSTLEKVADELKDIAVLGYIDSSVERKLSLQAGIKQSVELRVFLPLFPDSQMRFDELIYDANRFRPDFESASLRRIRRFVKGLDVGGEQFAPVLKNALQAIVRKEALGDHLSSIFIDACKLNTVTVESDQKTGKTEQNYRQCIRGPVRFSLQQHCCRAVWNNRILL